MLLIEDNFSLKLDCSTYVALGSFDGLHMGHIKLIDECINCAKSNNSKSMILTFKNHPLSIINKDLTPKLLMDNNLKVKLLKRYDIDIVNMVDFNKEFMQISPEGFVTSIIEHYNVKGIIAGFNYRFGYKNLGDIELLEKLSSKMGFDLHIVQPVKYESQIVSSSRIRNLLSEEGDIRKANSMLTRPFMIHGNIIKGKQLGRKLGFPTVNLDYNKDLVLPRGGVYYTNVEYNNHIYKGMTNIGYNPTVEDNKLAVETHILDFNKNVYDETIKIYFIDRIRDEKKFYSLDELICQQRKDKNYVMMKNIEIYL